MVPDQVVEEYRARGVVCLPGVFAEWVEQLRRGVESSLRTPGPNASEHVAPGDGGRFFEEYLAWDRVSEYRSFVFDSSVGPIGAQLMGSKRCQLFADHVFVKEVGTTKRTAWHQDASYSPFIGIQSINAWIALDSVPGADALQFVAGSHLESLTLPARSFDSGERYRDSVGADPDTIELDSRNIVSWDMAPGDTLFFDSRTIHGTLETTGLRSRRRALCVRMVGDDVRYAVRQGIPEFPWVGLVEGESLPADVFPILFDGAGD